MYRLIAFDLDGTFLDDGKHIPPDNLRAITDAAEKGIYIVPTTGRLYRGIPKEIADLPFVRYCILINGAKVYDAAEDTVISRAELSKETALALMDHACEIGCFYDAYIDDMGYMDRDMYEHLDDIVPDTAYVRYMRSIRTPIDSLKDYIRSREGTVQKVQYFFGDPAERLRQLELMPELFPQVKSSSSIASNMELNAVDAHKGFALRELCSHLGISTSEAIAFGDGLNDLEMICEAGMGVAMSNAEEKVLAAASRITCSNNEAGVAKAIYGLI